ncbi:40S ribosomal protein S20 [Lemmus lemmus]
MWLLRPGGVSTRACLVLFCPDVRCSLWLRNKLVLKLHCSPGFCRSWERCPRNPDIRFTRFESCSPAATSVKSLEKVSANTIRGAKEKKLKVKDQCACLPRQHHYKKTHCEGSKKWDHFSMRIHRAKHITSSSTEPGVEVEVTIAEA